ncbi:MAG: FAD-dependent oxidoreductase [Armatimonadetes bacterium]|nr:FAD-dependent oxidoreductase [Armatimonadota bacterium]
MHYVIVGNSAAAVGAVESIRRVDPRGEITVLSAEAEHVYSRPLIAHLVAGEVKENQMAYRPADFYTAHSVRARLGERVSAVDCARRRVTLASGETIGYDRLLLTTGSAVTRPSVLDRQLEGLVTFQTYADARKVLALLRAGKRQAVVVGAGLIGLRAADALKKAGAAVTVVEFLPRVLTRVLDAEASALVENLLRESGLNVLTGRAVREVLAREGAVSGVVLDDGEKLACQILVAATGVKPDLALAGDLATDHGILVNEYFQTSYSTVYAAGDVAQTRDLPRGVPRVNANWPNAHAQGRIAGLNMAGRPTPYPGSLGMNTVTFGGVPVISLGVFDPEAEEEKGYEVKIRKNPDRHIYQKLVFKENRLKGAIFIGDLGYCGAVKDMIAEQLLTGIIKDAILEEKYQLYGFLRKRRAEKLEGKQIRWPESYTSAQKYVKSFNEETWTERERDLRPW